MANSEYISASSELSNPSFTDLSNTGSFGNSIPTTGVLGIIASLRVGHVLGERFSIIKQVGIGGMGAVYQVHDHDREVDIAIKVMLPELANNDIAKQRFINEAKIAIKLTHPNIVKTYEVLEGAYLFITMELLEGRSLRQDIEARKRTNRPYTEAEALEIAYALCDALEYAHDYTVHRDIKPENIWITTNRQVKLMDFGIARMLNGSQIVQTSSGLGSAYYVAPEQFVGSKELDGRADQYSLGILLYELLTGQVPMGRAQSVWQQRKDVSNEVSNTIDRALSPNPQVRYPNIRAFADALKGAEKYLNQTTSRQNQTGQTGLAGLKSWIDQHRMITSLGVLLWGGVLVGTFLVYQDTQKQNQAKWEKWQSKMAKVFNQTEGLTGDADIRIQAWEKYLASYAKNNPLSEEDEDLRIKAEAYLQEAEAEKQESIRIAQQQKEARQKMQAQAALQRQQAMQQQAMQQQAMQQQAMQQQAMQQQAMQQQAMQQQAMKQPTLADKIVDKTTDGIANRAAGVIINGLFR